MFPVFVNDGSQEMPNEDIMYIVCKEGVYLKKKLGIMESITPVKSISTLSSVEMMATMHIKPIPGTQFAQVMAFFKRIYDEHHSEAIVLLFYNEEKRVYKIVPPAQEVSGASVDYNRAVTLDGYVMVGDIHSHAGMSAFHSGVDDADEKSFDGLHITIGNNRDKEVSISASIVSNGQRFIVQPEDYVNGIARTVDIDEVVEKPYSTVYRWDPQQKKLVPNQSTRTYKVKRFDRRYVSTVSPKYQRCPEAWFKLVTKKKWGGVSYGYGSWHSSWPNQGANSWRNWNTDHFDSGAWAQHRRNQHQTQGKLPVLPAQTKKPITFPPHQTGPLEEIVDDDFNPCMECPFKEHKLEWAASKYFDDEADEDDVSVMTDEAGNLIDWYRCDECHEVFSTPDDAAVCPKCNVDDHLVLLDQDDILEQSAESSDIDWYECKRCKSVFYTTWLTPQCPLCEKDDMLFKLHEKGEPEKYAAKVEPITTEYYYKCKECATETGVLNHGKCPFCGGDVMDNIDRDAAIAAAEEEDETMEKIPLPNPDENKIPLGTRKKQKRKPGVFARLFKDRK